MIVLKLIKTILHSMELITNLNFHCWSSEKFTWNKKSSRFLLETFHLDWTVILPECARLLSSFPAFQPRLTDLADPTNHIDPIDPTDPPRQSTSSSYWPHWPHQLTSPTHQLTDLLTHWPHLPTSLTLLIRFTDLTDLGTQGPGTQTDPQLTLNWPPTDPYWTQTDPAQPVRPTLKLHWPYCSLRLWLWLQPQPWPSGQTLSRPVDLLPTSTNLSQPAADLSWPVVEPAADLCWPLLTCCQPAANLCWPQLTCCQPQLTCVNLLPTCTNLLPTCANLLPTLANLSQPVADLRPISANLCLSQPTWICTNHCPSLLRNSKFSDLQFLDLDYSL